MKHEFAWTAFWALVGWACGLALGVWSEHEAMEREAVKLGHARYVVTAEREVKFEWVDCARKEQGK